MRVGGALAAVALVVALAVMLTGRGRAGTTSYPVPGERLPYTVEVLNGTTVDGLARTTTFRLRRAGLDVVSFGTSPMPADSTLILVRSGDAEAGGAVRDVLGVGRVVAEPDPDLLLDVTVILGRDAAGVFDRGP